MSVLPTTHEKVTAGEVLGFFFGRPPGPEDMLRQSIEGELRARGYRTNREHHLGDGQRCDLLAEGHAEVLIIETKVERPYHGLGQVLGYAELWRTRWNGPTMRAVLAVPMRHGSTDLMAACVRAGVELWAVTKDGRLISARPASPVAGRSELRIHDSTDPFTKAA